MKTLYTELKEAEKDSKAIKWAIISEFKGNPLVIDSIRSSDAIYNALIIATNPSLNYSRDEKLINKNRENLPELIGPINDQDNIINAKYLDRILNTNSYRSLLSYSNGVKINGRNSK